MPDSAKLMLGVPAVTLAIALGLLALLSLIVSFVDVATHTSITQRAVRFALLAVGNIAAMGIPIAFAVAALG